MSVLVFPAVVPDAIAKSSLLFPLSGTVYEAYIQLDTNLYTLNSTNQTYVEIYQGDVVERTLIVSSDQDVTMPSGVTKIRAWVPSGTNTIFSWTVKSIYKDIDSTLFTSGESVTITSSGTYTGTSTSGYAWVMAVGGGGGAGGCVEGGRVSLGGAMGGVGIGHIALTGSVSVTIGSAGTGGLGGQYSAPAVTPQDGTSGGNTSFGSLVANGGGGSYKVLQSQNGTGTGPGSVSGTYNGINLAGTYQSYLDGQDTSVLAEKSSSSAWAWIKSGITGHGSRGVATYPGGGVTGAFGKGGQGSGQYSGFYGTYGRGENASGYGAGGGGAYNTGRGGDGSPGVVFLWKY